MILVHTLSIEQVNNIYVCKKCNASFSGKGCIHRVRGHKELTGHIMIKIRA